MISIRTESLRLSAAGLALAMLTACAGGGPTRDAVNPDPLERVNRSIYRFNDTLDRYVGRPVARGYEKATPRALRTGLGNSLANLRYPITILNDLLQGKFRQGGADLGRFALNSTVGLLGFFDPAAAAGLQEHDEDLGQTFAVWGLPQGPYLMVPVLGPYTVGSAIGDLAGTQASLPWRVADDGAAIALTGLYLVDRRYSVLGLDEEIQRAFDPYLFIRDAYLQNRRYKIYDGNVPEEEWFPEDDFDDAAESGPES